MSKQADYDAIMAAIFKRHYRKGKRSFVFIREEMTAAARKLGIKLPKNLGDVIYSFRFRKALPNDISKTAPKGKEWIIELAGPAKYRFRLGTVSRILPRSDLITIKVPDATPEIIGTYALGDEQALLAKVRYNRLLDVFLGMATYSLQNHLRTTVSNVGQIEIDEIYVGVNRQGTQFVIPVQAKAGRDQIGGVQTRQDIACCAEKFPRSVCRPIAAQFMADDVIALFELAAQDEDIRVVDEKHYQLVPAGAISAKDMALYRKTDPSVA